MTKADEASPEEASRAPRLALFAVVAIKRGKRRVVLTVCNLSETGVLLETDEKEAAKLPIGSEHEISIFDRDHEQHRAVTLTAKVVRHDPRGVALSWGDDEPATKKIAQLMKVLAPRD